MGTKAPRARSDAVVKGVSLLIALQVLSRLATFSVNQLLLRFLTAPLLGLAAQLDMYYLSVLFFARESLRVAVQRQGVAQLHPAPAPEKQTGGQAEHGGGVRGCARQGQAVVNLGYLAVLLGAGLTILLAWLYLASAAAATLQTPYLVTSLRLYGLAAMIELFSEPCFLLMQIRLRLGARAAAESTATVLRCAVVFTSAVWASTRRHNQDVGVLPFALGQLAYGLSLSLVYWASTRRLAGEDGFSLLPRAASTAGDPKYVASRLHRPTVSLAGSIMAQSVFKHLLTQGDTFLVSVLSTPEVQGVYALVANYGGLLARLLFQPVEESSRSYFSRLLSSDQPLRKVPPPAVKEAKKNLQTLVRLYLLLSAVVVAIGPFAAPPLLSLLAGKQWIGSGAGETLAVYCFYIPFLALNGITESFVASVASEAEIHRQSVWMGGFSLAFAAAAFLFMQVLPLGATGLVLANTINMLCRVVWSFSFMTAFFSRHDERLDVSAMTPTGPLVVSLATLLLMHKFDAVTGAKSDPLVTLVRIAAQAIPLVLLMCVVIHRSPRDLLSMCASLLI